MSILKLEKSLNIQKNCCFFFYSLLVTFSLLLVLLLVVRDKNLFFANAKKRFLSRLRVHFNSLSANQNEPYVSPCGALLVS